VSQSRLAIDRNELQQLIGYYAVVCGKDPKLKYEVRHSLVQMALSQSIKAAARFYQVSRNTVRKWLRRYQESRIVGLEEHSRAPKRIPHRTDAATEARVVAIKKKLRRFGSRRLKRDFNCPAVIVLWIGSITRTTSLNAANASGRGGMTCVPRKPGLDPLSAPATTPNTGPTSLSTGLKPDSWDYPGSNTVIVIFGPG
jgi:transposase-like protein